MNTIKLDYEKPISFRAIRQKHIKKNFSLYFALRKTPLYFRKALKRAMWIRSQHESLHIRI